MPSSRPVKLASYLDRIGFEGVGLLRHVVQLGRVDLGSDYLRIVSDAVSCTVEKLLVAQTRSGRRGRGFVPGERAARLAWPVRLGMREGAVAVGQLLGRFTQGAFLGSQAIRWTW